MDILPWLLFGATLGVVARFAGLWAAKRFSPGSETPPESTPGSAWRSVSVVPGVGACATARRLGERRWLAGEAPWLPLAGCDSTRCQCRYRRHADRRDDEDRRDPLSTMGQFGGFTVTSSRERRARSERRGQ
jgi:hypothetical protein